MFDEVVFKCPTCLSEVRVQSKAGSCTLAEIDANEVPTSIAGDIIGASAYCRECERSWTVHGYFPSIVSMRLE
jgi:hypothetical protein